MPNHHTSIYAMAGSTIMTCKKAPVHRIYAIDQAPAIPGDWHIHPRVVGKAELNLFKHFVPKIKLIKDELNLFKHVVPELKLVKAELNLLRYFVPKMKLINAELNLFKQS